MDVCLAVQMCIPRMNLGLAWVWICMGFVSGLLLGLCFHREDWLGGYGSFRRCLYRLAHISFFGLGFVNLAFYLTVQSLAPTQSLLSVASGALIIGAGLMPLCCLLMAHFPRTRFLFAAPVLSLLLGGVITTAIVFH